MAMIPALREQVVVTFSPQPSVAAFLQRIVDAAGFITNATASTVEELETLVTNLSPAAIVYEVGFPFAANWHQLVQARLRPSLQKVPIVVTTGDARELYRRVGVPAAIELFRKPDDLTELRCAILEAIRETTPAQSV
jgi:DNA-binding response OmpR family regulator